MLAMLFAVSAESGNRENISFQSLLSTMIVLVSIPILFYQLLSSGIVTASRVASRARYTRMYIHDAHPQRLHIVGLYTLAFKVTIINAVMMSPATREPRTECLQRIEFAEINASQ